MYAGNLVMGLIIIMYTLLIQHFVTLRVKMEVFALMIGRVTVHLVIVDLSVKMVRN